MDENPRNKDPREDKDFFQFWRIPEGDCELLSTRYSTQFFGRHSHDRYAVGVISRCVEKLFYRGNYYIGVAGSVVTIKSAKMALSPINFSAVGENRLFQHNRPIPAGHSRQTFTQRTVKGFMSHWFDPAADAVRLRSRVKESERDC
nr:AraC family ligand binding domain-containing protein [Pseudomonas veronii]